MVDDQYGNGFFGGFEFEAELLLDGGEEGWGGVIGVGRVVGGPLEFEIVAAGKSGFVDDDAAGDLGDLLGDDGCGQALAMEVCAADADGLPLDFEGWSFGPPLAGMRS